MQIKHCVFIGGKQIGVNCLRQLLKRNILPKLLIANPDDNTKSESWHESILEVAKKNKIKTTKIRKVNTRRVIKKIKVIHPEIIFCIGSTQILSREIIDVPKLGCLNIHPSLLSKYRGRYSIPYTIFNGEKFIGVTLCWINEGVDSGPVIIQKKIKIEEDDTAKTLYDKFTLFGERLFAEFLDILLRGKKIISVPQDHKQATYCPKGLPNRGQIDWSWDGKKIRRFIRAIDFEPFPPVNFFIGNKKMVIIDEKYFRGYGEK